MGFFKSLPKEIEESPMVDGGSLITSIPIAVVYNFFFLDRFIAGFTVGAIK